MPLEIIKSQINNIPENSGVYQFFGAENEVLYVGKAKNLRKRLQSYTRTEALSRRIARMVFLAQKLEFIQTTTELEALLLEHNLIKKLAPKYNILLRDGKTFPHILITKSNFPQITKHRGVKKDDGRYFGPFAAASDVNKTIDILKKSFLLRDCQDSEFNRRNKPCLEYQIKRCSAPCVGLISQLEYKKSVENAVDFLSGKSALVQEELSKKMQFFSKNLEYEKAAIMRDKIKALTSIQLKQNINIEGLENCDIITLVEKDSKVCIYISFFRGGNNYGAKPYFFDSFEQNLADLMSEFLGQFYLSQNPPRLILLNLDIAEVELIESFLGNLNNEKIIIKIPKQGDKLKIIKDQEKIALQNLEQKLVQDLSNLAILTEVKNLFELNNLPQKIEVYDNSHISGQYAVGVLITAGVEGFIKSGYRKFNIRFDEIDNRDDTAMLREVLTRRFSKLEKKHYPSLIIIDGGKTQLKAASEVFAKLQINIPFVCMSKGENRNAGEENFHQIGKDSFTLAKNHPVMYYLQRLRDEAHRFAITTHRNKRAKSVSKSSLDEISGIGKSRKKALLNHFGSVDKIKSASVDDLTKIDGISQKIAEKIKEFF